MIDKKQKEALDNALKMINKKYGDEAVMKMNDIPKMMPSISTGSLGLDIALGIGGVPQGRIIEIYGPESSGKTTLTLQIIREAQKLNQVAAFIDAEHALDPKYARSLGVNMDDLIVSQPDCGEQAMDIVETLIDSSAINLIVIDSVAALTPKKELEGEMGDANVGLQARLMSQALRKITSKAKQNNVTVVFINQIRMKIGVMFGSPETTTGGNALKFYASVRMDIRRTGSVKDGDEVIGNETKVKVVKNKIAPPFKETNFEILYGSGVDNYGEVLDYATKMELVQKSGAWYSCNGEKIGQGKVKTVAYLKENNKLFDELNQKIRDKYLNLEAIEKASSQNTETDSDIEIADE